MKQNQITAYLGSSALVFYGCPIDADNDFIKPLTLETIEHVLNGHKNFVVKLALKSLEDLSNIAVESHYIWNNSPRGYSVSMLKNGVKTDTLLYRDMTKLIEMGYDVFNAIPRRGAVDINRVEVSCESV